MPTVATIASTWLFLDCGSLLGQLLKAFHITIWLRRKAKIEIEIEPLRVVRDKSDSLKVI